MLSGLFGDFPSLGRVTMIAHSISLRKDPTDRAFWNKEVRRGTNNEGNF